MLKKNLLLTSACLLLTACGTIDAPSYSYGPKSFMSESNTARHVQMDLHQIYAHREPCQNYVSLPEGFEAVRNCGVEKILPVTEAVEVVPVVKKETVIVATPEAPKLLPRTKSYTVNFDYDKSSIRTDAWAILDEVSHDIKTHKPEQVTVTGYTDTAGPRDYNERLSKARAEAVSRVLKSRGIESQIIDEEARGEDDLAVPTPDGVPHEENRRAVIDFRR